MMSNYSECPLSDSGLHSINYDKWRGFAKCVFCGFVLVQTTPSEKSIMSEKSSFRYQRLRRGATKI